MAFEAHNTKYGEFAYLDRLDGKVDHEFFYVTSQQEWLYFASEFKRICDEIMQHYMGMERQRLAIQLAEAELAKERDL